MIYLIETTYYNKDTKEVLDLLKIGYTKDIDSRVDSYYLHSPECKLLDTREGDTELESYFHSLYNKYSYPKRREWFYYSQEIVDNFQKISLDDKYLISKEDYIVGFREYLKSEVPGIQELKSKYLDSILKEIEELSVSEGLEELYNPEFHRSLTVGIWEKEYNSEISYIDSYDFEELFRDYSDKIDIQKNPWKNSATFYYRTTADYREMKKEDFQNIIDSKNKSTESLLSAYNTVLDKDKYDLAKTYQYVAKSANYRDNYIAVNKVINSQTGDVILKPVINQLVLVNEIRAFQIQQVDYKDRFSVFSSVHSKLTPDDIVNRDVTRFFCIYDTLTTMHDKLKMLCEYNFISDIELNIVLGQIADSDEVKSYYLALGPKKLKALTYSKTYIKKELGIVTFSKELLINTITLNFNPGEKYSLSDLKVKLGNLYNSINYDATPKASDIENYFDVKSVVMYEKKEDGTRKQIRGYELLKRK